jgi:hypothetical protein
MPNKQDVCWTSISIIQFLNTPLLHSNTTLIEIVIFSHLAGRTLSQNGSDLYLFVTNSELLFVSICDF